MFYYRYTMTENQIEKDVERGYSFRYYDLHESIHSLVEDSPYIEMYGEFWNIIEENDIDEMSEEELLDTLEDAGIDVRQDNITGMWGLAYDGLSAFGEFETAEEAEEAAKEWHYDGTGEQPEMRFCAIVEGEITGEADDNELDTIIVKNIVKVIAK